MRMPHSRLRIHEHHRWREDAQPIMEKLRLVHGVRPWNDPVCRQIGLGRGQRIEAGRGNVVEVLVVKRPDLLRRRLHQLRCVAHGQVHSVTAFAIAVWYADVAAIPLNSGRIWFANTMPAAVSLG